jgi:hypothetical protein
MSHGRQWHADPPWSSDHGRPWAHRSHVVRPLQSMGAHRDDGKRKRGVESSPRLKSAGSTSGWGRWRRGASGGSGNWWWAALEHGEVEKKAARGARGAFYRPARRTEGAGGVGSSAEAEIQWSRRFHGVKRGGELTECWVREGEGKAAGRRFDSATHKWGRTTDDDVWHGGRSNGWWWRGIGTKEKVPRVGWLGPKWAESWAGYKKIPGKMKRVAKIVWAKNELGSTAEFWI